MIISDFFLRVYQSVDPQIATTGSALVVDAGANHGVYALTAAAGPGLWSYGRTLPEVRLGRTGHRLPDTPPPPDGMTSKLGPPFQAGMRSGRAG